MPTKEELKAAAEEREAAAQAKIEAIYKRIRDTVVEGGTPDEIAEEEADREKAENLVYTLSSLDDVLQTARNVRPVQVDLSEGWAWGLARALVDPSNIVAAASATMQTALNPGVIASTAHLVGVAARADQRTMILSTPETWELLLTRNSTVREYYDKNPDGVVKLVAANSGLAPEVVKAHVLPLALNLMEAAGESAELLAPQICAVMGQGAVFNASKPMDIPELFSQIVEMSKTDSIKKIFVEDEGLGQLSGTLEALYATRPEFASSLEDYGLDITTFRDIQPVLQGLLHSAVSNNENKDNVLTTVSMLTGMQGEEKLDLPVLFNTVATALDTPKLKAALTTPKTNAALAKVILISASTAVSNYVDPELLKKSTALGQALVQAIGENPGLLKTFGEIVSSETTPAMVEKITEFINDPAVQKHIVNNPKAKEQLTAVTANVLAKSQELAAEEAKKVAEAKAAKAAKEVEEARKAAEKLAKKAKKTKDRIDYNKNKAKLDREKGLAKQKEVRAQRQKEMEERRAARARAQKEAKERAAQELAERKRVEREAAAAAAAAIAAAQDAAAKEAAKQKAEEEKANREAEAQRQEAARIVAAKEAEEQVRREAEALAKAEAEAKEKARLEEIARKEAAAKEREAAEQVKREAEEARRQVAEAERAAAAAAAEEKKAEERAVVVRELDAAVKPLLDTVLSAGLSPEVVAQCAGLVDPNISMDDLFAKIVDLTETPEVKEIFAVAENFEHITNVLDVMYKSNEAIQKTLVEYGIDDEVFEDIQPVVSGLLHSAMIHKDNKKNVLETVSMIVGLKNEEVIDYKVLFETVKAAIETTPMLQEALRDDPKAQKALAKTLLATLTTALSDYVNPDDLVKADILGQKIVAAAATNPDLLTTFAEILTSETNPEMVGKIGEFIADPAVQEHIVKNPAAKKQLDELIGDIVVKSKESAREAAEAKAAAAAEAEERAKAELEAAIKAEEEAKTVKKAKPKEKAKVELKAAAAEGSVAEGAATTSPSPVTEAAEVNTADKGKPEEKSKIELEAAVKVATEAKTAAVAAASAVTEFDTGEIGHLLPILTSTALETGVINQFSLLISAETEMLKFYEAVKNITGNQEGLKKIADNLEGVITQGVKYHINTQISSGDSPLTNKETQDIVDTSVKQINALLKNVMTNPEKLNAIGKMAKLYSQGSTMKAVWEAIKKPSLLLAIPKIISIKSSLGSAVKQAHVVIQQDPSQRDLGQGQSKELQRSVQQYKQRESHVAKLESQSTSAKRESGRH